MDAAVAKLTVMEVSLLSTLTSQLGDTSHSLTFALILLDFLLKDISTIFFVDMQIVVDLTLQEVANILVDALAIWRHLGATKLNLGLALEYWLFYVDSYGSHDTITDIGIFIVLIEEFLYSLCDMLLEGTLMSTALSGMLTIYERMVFLAILISMGESNLYILAHDMNDRIQAVVGHIVVQQVFKTITALYTATIIHDGQSRVEVGIVAQHHLYNLAMEGVVLEESVIRLKIYVCTILILSLRSLVRNENTFLEGKMSHLTITKRLHLEV